MKKYDSFLMAEKDLINSLMYQPDYITGETYENLSRGFILTNPSKNRNNRSNYEYAEAFFEWLLTGNTDLSSRILDLNPMAQKFVDSTGLPEGFSSSYGWKIKAQMPTILQELSNQSTRRAYLPILLLEDQIILSTDTTHEYPCTTGIHFLVRDKKLSMIVHMRSNNAWSVLPYDVYNFTSLQAWVAKQLFLPMGNYYHQMNSVHVFKRDIAKIEAWIWKDLGLNP